MSRGDSGRIVIEIEPETKRQLYSTLALSGSTLKDWFLKVAEDYVANRNQPPLPGVLYPQREDRKPTLKAAEAPAPYTTNNKDRS